MTELHHHTLNSDVYQKLMEEPTTGSELTSLPKSAYGIYGRFRPWGMSQSSSVESVYYIYGDERRAIRKFVEVNHDYLDRILDNPSNTLQRNWDEIDYQILKEEWEWYKFRNENGI